ncbi:GIY-YIG nuclease family protein, partial [Burkholderia cenocepacia]|nr:GIY-YIG nuclease family protein [Burkholderia cenocepacia]
MFTKELFHLLKQEPGISQAGLYILVGNAAEETIYIGEADPVGDRLKTHVANKEGWIWGVYFFDRNHKIGKTEVQFLESELVALAKKHDRA